MPTFALVMTIPANTPKENPLIKVAELIKGIIKTIRLQHPTGCEYDARVNFSCESNRILPVAEKNDAVDYLAFESTNPEPFPVDYKMQKDRAIIIMQGWNLDAVYEHTITAFIEVEPQGAQ